MFKFIFSALYNETADYLDVFVANFLNYTDQDTALIVNLGHDVPVPLDRDFGPRVRLIRGEVLRAPWGSTLLAGHMESFGYADNVFPDFGWFITIASNCLFFRRFDGALAVADAVSRTRPSQMWRKWNALSDDWNWPLLRGFETAGERMRLQWGIDGLESGQIEGCMASRADWALTAGVAADLAGYWDGLKAPLEEIMPPTVIDSIGSGQRNLICHIYWTEDARFIRLDDMIDTQSLPRHVCMMKRFRREPLNAETLIVSTPLGQSLLLAMQQAAPGSQEDLNIEVLLRLFLAQVEARRQPVLFHPGGTLRDTPSPEPLDMVAVRQICGLDGGPAEAGEPFLYFENTGARVLLAIHAPEPGRLCIACQAHPAQEGAEIPVGLQAHLCLPAPQALRLRLSGHVKGVSVEEVVEKIVWGDESYSILPPHAWTVGDEGFVAQYRLPQRKQQSLLCLPLCAGQALDVELLWERSEEAA